MFKAGVAYWAERFEQFSVFRYFLKETEHCTVDIFVQMLLGGDREYRLDCGVITELTRSFRIALLQRQSQYDIA